MSDELARKLCHDLEIEREKQLHTEKMERTERVNRLSFQDHDHDVANGDQQRGHHESTRPWPDYAAHINRVFAEQHNGASTMAKQKRQSAHFQELSISVPKKNRFSATERHADAFDAPKPRESESLTRSRGRQFCRIDTDNAFAGTAIHQGYLPEEISELLIEMSKKQYRTVMEDRLSSWARAPKKKPRPVTPVSEHGDGTISCKMSPRSNVSGGRSRKSPLSKSRLKKSSGTSREQSQSPMHSPSQSSSRRICAAKELPCYGGSKRAMTIYAKFMDIAQRNLMAKSQEILSTDNMPTAVDMCASVKGFHCVMNEEHDGWPIRTLRSHRRLYWTKNFPSFISCRRMTKDMIKRPSIAWRTTYGVVQEC